MAKDPVSLGGTPGGPFGSTIPTSMNKQCPYTPCMEYIYAYIDPPNHPNVGIYGIHGVSGMDIRRCRIEFLGFRKHLRVSAHLRIAASEWIPWTHRRPFSLRGGTGLDLHRSPDAAAAPDTRMQKDTQASVSSMNDANGLEEMQKSERSKMGEIKGLKAFQHDIYIY